MFPVDSFIRENGDTRFWTGMFAFELTNGSRHTRTNEFSLGVNLDETYKTILKYGLSVIPKRPKSHRI